jgi:hypothetical protein
MSFGQAPSNPFQFSPEGTLSVRSTSPTLPALGMPKPYETPLHINSLGPGLAVSYPGKCLKVLEESDSGRNMRFENTITGQVLSLAETVGAVTNGQFPDYEICIINGIETPRSKADGSTSNNLG